MGNFIQIVCTLLVGGALGFGVGWWAKAKYGVQVEQAAQDAAKKL